MKWVPSEPRCKLCSAPFGGIGGAILPFFGYGRWEGNPALCGSCFRDMEREGLGGAEIPLSLLFADIRGSTGLAEHQRPVEFTRLLDRFYRLTAKAVLDHNGLVDKFVGDEIVAMFIPAVAGHDHAAQAVSAARALLGAVGRPDATSSGPIPVGAAIHTGEAYVGIVGQSRLAWDFTALGDTVNTTARLAAVAAAGEALVSLDAAAAAGLEFATLEHRTIALRGRSEPITVVAVRPTD
jgi:adenylate cyclase